MLEANKENSELFRTIIGGVYGLKTLLSYTAMVTNPILARVRAFIKSPIYYKQTSTPTVIKS
jgi:hypothetical protein